jgi:hypothetical protein
LQQPAHFQVQRLARELLRLPPHHLLRLELLLALP